MYSRAKKAKEDAKKAAEAFAANDELTTFTEDDIEDGGFFAVRWGLGEDCVMVFKIDGDPIVYDQLISQEHL